MERGGEGLGRERGGGERSSSNLPLSTLDIVFLPKLSLECPLCGCPRSVAFETFAAGGGRGGLRKRIEGRRGRSER